MFNFLDEDTDGFGNLFAVDNGYAPNTPLSTPDAIKTGNALSNLGFFGNNTNGETDLTNGVKAFQNANGLKVDGVINPGGPTENAISKALSQKNTPSTDSTDNTLASHVTVSKPVDTNPDQEAWSASASFGAPKKTKAPKPKIDPITGLADPLASVHKGKMPTAKQWEDVAKMQMQKVATSVVPEGDTVQQRIQSMMMNALYNDKSDSRLRDHVQHQFQKAYPGQVEYEETGKMVQPQAAIQPDEVDAFDPNGELQLHDGTTPQTEKPKKPKPSDTENQKEIDTNSSDEKQTEKKDSDSCNAIRPKYQSVKRKYNSVKDEYGKLSGEYFGYEPKRDQLRSDIQSGVSELGLGTAARMLLNWIAGGMLQKAVDYILKHVGAKKARQVLRDMREFDRISERMNEIRPKLKPLKKKVDDAYSEFDRIRRKVQAMSCEYHGW